MMMLGLPSGEASAMGPRWGSSIVSAVAVMVASPEYINVRSTLALQYRRLSTSPIRKECETASHW